MSRCYRFPPNQEPDLVNPLASEPYESRRVAQGSGQYHCTPESSGEPFERVREPRGAAIRDALRGERIGLTNAL